jgi:hypothetical protein
MPILNNKEAKASESCGVVKLTPQDENERGYYILLLNIVIFITIKEMLHSM